ncbi:MAG: class I SAM-dependent methyltransferase [Phycisphaerales bacterium]|nr:MAG: class I SAM-dependent methyltransferase [Phycisphaerales bacterium]
MRVREMDIELYRNYFNTLEAGREPGWQYNELKPCGVNYNSALCALWYDMHHGRFRDFQKEGKEIIALLGLDTDQTVIDMGCGTGAFAVHAARHCRKVYAVDVSRAMLRCARRKAKKAKLNNIEFHRGGFLTYEHEAKPADAIVSTAVLHHLPDFWKLTGLRRLARMCKAGGKLYLFDVVFSFNVDEYKSHLDEWVKSTAERIGPAFAAEVKTHVREEYSTFDWVMEGMFERAGFAIEKANYQNDFMVAYLCTRKGESI